MGTHFVDEKGASMFLLVRWKKFRGNHFKDCESTKVNHASHLVQVIQYQYSVKERFEMPKLLPFYYNGKWIFVSEGQLFFAKPSEI